MKKQGEVFELMEGTWRGDGAGWKAWKVCVTFVP